MDFFKIIENEGIGGEGSLNNHKNWVNIDSCANKA